MFDASLNRAEHGDANDTRATISEIAQLRAKKAALFGYANFADYTLYDQMAKDRRPPSPSSTAWHRRLPPRNARNGRRHRRARQVAGRDLPADPGRLELLLRADPQERFALNNDELKPYFEFNKVLTDGVFYAANQLYGLTFTERKDIPTWNPDMRVFQVDDQDGKPLAIFIIDPWKRDNKQGGAWMSNLVNQSYLRGTKPVVFNVENFTKPAPGQPALISWDDVTTMFHEFGHALHGMFAAQTYPTLSGTNVARDFVEFPSQFNENWALDPKVLPHYAVNYQTGQPIPQELVDKIKRSQHLQPGLCRWRGAGGRAARPRLALAAGDARRGRMSTSSRRMRSRTAASMPPTCRRATAQATSCTSGATAIPPVTMPMPGPGCSAQDAFAWFENNGGLTRANGQRFRNMVLSRGNTLDLAAMYRGFAGHDASIQPYLEYYGLPTDAGAAPTPPAGRTAPATAPAPPHGERGRLNP